MGNLRLKSMKQTSKNKKKKKNSVKEGETTTTMTNTNNKNNNEVSSPKTTKFEFTLTKDMLQKEIEVKNEVLMQPKLLETTVIIPKNRCPGSHLLQDRKTQQVLPPEVRAFMPFGIGQPLFCDNCRTEQPGLVTVHSCRKCEYDICESCYNSAIHHDEWKAQEETSSEKAKHVQVETQAKQIGVSLEHLRSFKMTNAWGNEVSPSIYQVCETIIKRNSSENMTSYIERLASDPQTQHHVGKADFFVSYAWSYSWKELMDALVDETGFVWIDLVTVNQHVSQAVELDGWLHTFGDAIEGIGKVVLVLAPWDDPIPARRSWCTFEMYVTSERNIPVSVRIPSGEKQNFMESLKTMPNGSVFQNILGQIDIMGAEAYKEEDRQAILKLIRQAGPIKVNDIVLNAVKKWLKELVDEAVLLTDNPQQNNLSGEDCIRLLDNAGSFIELGWQDPQAALKLYERSLAKAIEVFPPDHVAIVMEMCNVATILQHKPETRAQARKYYEDGIEMTLRRENGNRKNQGLCTLLSNLSILAAAEENLDEALKLSKEAMDTFTELYSRTDPNTQTMLNNYASFLFQAKKYEEALPLSREIVETAEEYSGMQKGTDDDEFNTVAPRADPFLALAYNNLAEVLRELGKYQEAEKYYKRAYSIHERVNGKESKHCTDVLFNLNKIPKQ